MKLHAVMGKWAERLRLSRLEDDFESCLSCHDLVAQLQIHALLPHSMAGGLSQVEVYGCLQEEEHL